MLSTLEFNFLRELYLRADKTQKAKFIDWTVGLQPNEKPLRCQTVEEYLSARSGQPTCPRCGSKHLVKNGRSGGRQRYLCKDCGKTVGLSRSSFYCNTKKPLLVWEQFHWCMGARMPLRRAAKQCNISLPTAVAWKKKYAAGMTKVFIGWVRNMQQQGILPEELDCDALAPLVETKARTCFNAQRRKGFPRGSVITPFVPPNPYRY